jgi:hypothetical protein
MKSTHLGVALLLCNSIVSLGCQGDRLAGQGIAFREALLEMYDDQLWDSLIRAKCYQPFVLLDFTELFAEDMEEASAEGSYQETVASKRTTTLGAASTTLGERLVTPLWAAKATAKRVGKMNFKAKPVDNAAVVDAVVSFARNHVNVNETLPPNTHAYRKKRDQYYYVLKDDAEAFLALGLRCAVPLDASAAELGFYRTTIVGIADEPSQDPASSQPVKRIRFSSPVPNGAAILETPQGAFEIRGDDAKLLGVKTFELLITWRSGFSSLLQESLKGASVRVFSLNDPPVRKSREQREAERFQSLINSVDRMR